MKKRKGIKKEQSRPTLSQSKYMNLDQLTYLKNKNFSFLYNSQRKSDRLSNKVEIVYKNDITESEDESGSDSNDSASESD